MDNFLEKIIYSGNFTKILHTIHHKHLNFFSVLASFLKNSLRFWRIPSNFGKDLKFLKFWKVFGKFPLNWFKFGNFGHSENDHNYHFTCYDYNIIHTYYDCKIITFYKISTRHPIVRFYRPIVLKRPIILRRPIVLSAQLSAPDCPRARLSYRLYISDGHFERVSSTFSSHSSY